MLDLAAAGFHAVMYKKLACSACRRPPRICFQPPNSLRRS